ncbi:MAG: N-6 DNA methylase [Oscillospiraceae bacterium]|nr:N-6 DNA methylase [Oscillospiraceae bacterium]
MAKKKAEEKINLDSILFKCRDILRAARNSGSFFEKRDMMLTLVFLRFIGEKFEDGVENLCNDLRAQGLDPDDPEIRAAFLDDPTFTDGTYNLLPEARWSTIINTPAPKLNVALDAALRSIASNSPQLKGCFVEGTFTTRNLAPNDIKKLIDEVNKISHKAFGEEKDLIGRVYEYFLKEFAVNATKEEGEYYTPHDVVQLIAAMIEPFDGTLYDPCCGSGGMFIQSAELVKAKRGDISRINVYGQEKEAATYRLAKMNLALRGISHKLGDVNDSSFTHDLWKGIYFNYIMANPPFNLKGWYNSNLANDARWADYVTPPESNANYAWILHILSHLQPLDGVAGFLLANGALGDSDTLAIRQKLIQNDKVEAIIILPRELFITTDISVTLWILNQNKKGGAYHGRQLRNREHEILFMDLRTWTENPVKGENKKKVRLLSTLDVNVEEQGDNAVYGQIERAAGIYHTWQCEGTDGKHYEVPELYRSVGIDDIKANGWSLIPSKYITFIDHDLEINFPAEMRRIQQEMKEVLEQEEASQKMLVKAFEGIGYGIKKRDTEE